MMSGDFICCILPLRRCTCAGMRRYMDSFCIDTEFLATKRLDKNGRLSVSDPVHCQSREAGTLTLGLAGPVGVSACWPQEPTGSWSEAGRGALLDDQRRLMICLFRMGMGCDQGRRWVMVVYDWETGMRGLSQYTDES